MGYSNGDNTDSWSAEFEGFIDEVRSLAVTRRAGARARVM